MKDNRLHSVNFLCVCVFVCERVCECVHHPPGQTKALDQYFGLYKVCMCV